MSGCRRGNNPHRVKSTGHGQERGKRRLRFSTNFMPELQLVLPPAASEQIMAARARKTIIYQVSRRRRRRRLLLLLYPPPSVAPSPLLL